jgi:hypothetical protein
MWQCLVSRSRGDPFSVLLGKWRDIGLNVIRYLDHVVLTIIHHAKNTCVKLSAVGADGGATAVPGGDPKPDN